MKIRTGVIFILLAWLCVGAIPLKQSTAVRVLLGPFVDEDDGKTAEAALTIEDTEVYLWQQGDTAMAVKNDANNCDYEALGYYSCLLDTTDTATAGMLVISVHESGALPVRHEFVVLPANIYGGTVDGSDDLIVDVNTVKGAAPVTAANVQAECEDALVAWKLDTLLGGTADVNDGSVIAVLAAIGGDWSDFNAANHSLEAIRGRGDSAWITAATVDLNADQSGVTIGTVNNATIGTIGGMSEDALKDFFENFISPSSIASGSLIDRLINGTYDENVSTYTTPGTAGYKLYRSDRGGFFGR